jgi:hypothetical protein
VRLARDRHDFPRAALWSLPLPVLMMAITTAYNGRRVSTIYFGDELEKSIEDFRQWIEMMVKTEL